MIKINRTCLLALLTLIISINSLAQIKDPPIPDSIKEYIISNMTDANIDFLADKNPKYTWQDKHSVGGTIKLNGRAVMGFEERAPGSGMHYYHFTFDIQRTNWSNIYLAIKRNNCLSADIYTDLHKKDLYMRDTVCFDMDSAIFPYDKRFLFFYDPTAEPCCRARSLAGNIDISNDLLKSDKYSMVFNCGDRARMRLMQFGNAHPAMYMDAPDSCNYYRYKFILKEFSSQPILVRFPKQSPYNWTEVEFYTNNKKYWKDSTTDWKGEIYRVQYHLSNQPKDITEWYPVVTKLTNKDVVEVEKTLGKEFIERIRYPMKRLWQEGDPVPSK